MREGTGKKGSPFRYSLSESDDDEDVDSLSTTSPPYAIGQW